VYKETGSWPSAGGGDDVSRELVALDDNAELRGAVWVRGGGTARPTVARALAGLGGAIAGSTYTGAARRTNPQQQGHLRCQSPIPLAIKDLPTARCSITFLKRKGPDMTSVGVRRYAPCAAGK
jgi:hypothetical protein